MALSTTAAAAAAAAAAEANDAKLNRLVAAQLQKTKMCAIHQRGICRDPNCRFAHSPDELRSAPDLTKTAICRMFTRGQCRNSTCKFAHGEQELRVTPSVYKTQLCNFHSRGHCKKGNRCRHAHGEDELRSFLAQQAAASPSRTATPAFSTVSDDSQSTATTNHLTISDDFDSYDSMDTSFDRASQDLRAFMSAPATCWSPVGPSPPSPEWWAAYLAAGGPSPSHVATPPHANMYSALDRQATPDKVVPPFPRGIPARTGSPETAEPMKVALSPSNAPDFSAPSPLANPALPRPTPLPLGRVASHEDMNLLTSVQFAWATQAKMDYELAAAQLKVQELQAKRQLYTAAQFAATANGLALPGAEGHFDSIMQNLRPSSRPASPAEMVQAAMLQGRNGTPTPPGLEQPAGRIEGGSGVLTSPREGPRAPLPWHPTDFSQKHSTAWVI